MTSRKAFPMTEYVPTPEDDELEATIGRLFDQLEDAREDSGILERMMPCFSTCSGDSPVSRAVRSMLSLTCSIIGLPRA
jgi:hypothetical protein